jgi:hypothetical protein
MELESHISQGSPERSGEDEADGVMSNVNLSNAEVKGHRNCNFKRVVEGAGGRLRVSRFGTEVDSGDKASELERSVPVCEGDLEIAVANTAEGRELKREVRVKDHGACRNVDVNVKLVDRSVSAVRPV